MPVLKAACIREWNDDELDQAEARPTSTPPFDPRWFAKEIEAFANRKTEAPTRATVRAPVNLRPGRVDTATEVTPIDELPTERMLRAAAPWADESKADDLPKADESFVRLTPRVGARPGLAEATTVLGRRMYGVYLASDYPAALELAEMVLLYEPAHAIARLVAERCRQRIAPTVRSVIPSSIVGLRRPSTQVRRVDAQTSRLLNQIDGMTDAATIAELAGIPANEILDRLSNLLELGMIEIVD